MANETNIFSWLAKNLQEADPKSYIPSMAIYNRYNAYCERNLLLPATKIFIGLAIKVLFPKAFCHHRQYSGVGWHGSPQKKDIVLPAYCGCTTDGNLTVSVPTESLLNGQVVTKKVIIWPDKSVDVFVGDVQIQQSRFGIVQKIDDFYQGDIDSVLLPVTKGNLCRGVTFDEDVEASPTLQWGLWSKLTDENTAEKRLRHKKCDLFILFNRTNGSSACRKCSQSLPNLLRRRKERETLREEPSAKKSMANEDTDLMKRTPHEESQEHNEESEEHDEESEEHDEEFQEHNEEYQEHNEESEEHNEESQDTSDGIEDEDLINLLERILPEAPPKYKVLLKSQLTNCRNQDPSQRQWPPEIISICLSMWCRSPQAYQDLKESEMLLLPSSGLLQQYKNAVEQKPGAEG